MPTMRPQRKSRKFWMSITSKKSLKIPKKFTKEHRRKILLNNDVVLIVSDDKAWSLGCMVSCDGNIWLQNGWPEFAQHYRLKIGDLLVFEHLGKSLFHVRIFKENDPSFAQDDHAVSPHTFQETKGKTDLSSENRDKYRSTNYKALEAAKAFMADNPNSYIREMKASYTRSYGLNIPLWFMRRYLTSNEDCVLELSNGRKWGPIKCKGYKISARMYGDNWKKFHDENHLVVDDVCVFEMTSETEKVLKVTIFHACGNYSS